MVWAGALLRTLALLVALGFVATGTEDGDNGGRSMGGQTLQRCFVCVSRESNFYSDEIRRIFPEYPPPPSCDFQPPAPTPEMVRTCPPQFSSCLTIFNGSLVSRTCGELPVLDCKYANKIRYCYCIGDLCNGVQDNSANNPSSLGGLEHSDDEDLGDGSGNGGANEGSGGLRPPYNDGNYFPPLTAAGSTTNRPGAGNLASNDMTVNVGTLALQIVSIFIWK